MDDALLKRLPAAESMPAMTEQGLKAAFLGESQAAQKYTVCAEQAEEDLPNIAPLFRATSFAETRHERNHLRVLGAIGSTLENLKEALEGEAFEIEETYPAYAEIARLQAMSQAARTIRYAQRAEVDHKQMYLDTREQLLEGADIREQAVGVCLIYGHTVIGDLLEKCLVCAAPKEHYKTF